MVISLKQHSPGWLRLVGALIVCMAPEFRAACFAQDWLETALLTPQQKGEVEALRGARPLDFSQLERLIDLYASADVQLAELVAQFEHGHVPAEPAEGLLATLPPEVLADVSLGVAAQHHVRRRYLQSLAWLDRVDPQLCSSPQLYWHYRAVAAHQLVRMEEAEHAAEQLLAVDLPSERRLHELARMILRDSKAHKSGSLTHIARRMGDVRRRLWLGEGGEPSQQLQQEVIDALDELIKKTEEQRRQQQQQQQQQQLAQSESSQPMQQSRIADLKGPGEVDERDIPAGGDWGALPPAERERVTQQIIRDFPTHYREVIKDYFRSLANEPSLEEENR